MICSLVLLFNDYFFFIEYLVSRTLGCIRKISDMNSITGVILTQGVNLEIYETHYSCFPMCKVRISGQPT